MSKGPRSMSNAYLFALEDREHKFLVLERRFVAACLECPNRQLDGVGDDLVKASDCIQYLGLVGGLDSLTSSTSSSWSKARSGRTWVFDSF
jgi:hypothetical protein